MRNKEREGGWGKVRGKKKEKENDRWKRRDRRKGRKGKEGVKEGGCEFVHFLGQRCTTLQKKKTQTV